MALQTLPMRLKRARDAHGWWACWVCRVRECLRQVAMVKLPAGLEPQQEEWLRLTPRQGRRSLRLLAAWHSPWVVARLFALWWRPP